MDKDEYEKVCDLLELIREAEKRHGGPLVSDKSKLAMVGIDIDLEMEEVRMRLPEATITEDKKHKIRWLAVGFDQWGCTCGFKHWNYLVVLNHIQEGNREAT